QVKMSSPSRQISNRRLPPLPNSTRSSPIRRIPSGGSAKTTSVSSTTTRHGQATNHQGNQVNNHGHYDLNASFNEGPFRPALIQGKAVGERHDSHEAHVDSESARSYLQSNPMFLDEFVMKHVDQDRLERWLIRKTRKLKQKGRMPSADRENSKQNGNKQWLQPLHHRASLSKWKFCVHSDKKKMLEELTHDIHTQPNKQKVLLELANCIASACHADGYVLYLVDSNGQDLYIHNPNLPEGKTSVAIKIQEQTTIAAYVAYTLKPVRTSDIFGDERFPEGIGVDGTTAQSVLCQPIVQSNSELVGTIELTRTVGRDPFDEEDEEIVNSYLVWGGISLYYAEMYHHMHKHRKLTEFLLNVTSVFKNISMALSPYMLHHSKRSNKLFLSIHIASLPYPSHKLFLSNHMASLPYPSHKLFLSNHMASLPYPSHKLFLSNHMASLPYPSHKLFLSNHMASLPYPSHKLFLSNHIASLPYPSHKLFLSNHMASLPYPSHKLFLSNHMASLPYPSHKLFLSNHMASLPYPSHKLFLSNHIASLPYPSHKLFLSNHIASLPYPSHKLFLSNHMASLPYPSHKLFLSNHMASLPYPSHKLFLSNHIASLPYPSHKLFLSNHIASLPYPSHKLFLSNHMASLPYPSHKLFLSNHMASLPYPSHKLFLSNHIASLPYPSHKLFLSNHMASLPYPSHKLFLSNHMASLPYPSHKLFLSNHIASLPYPSHKLFLSNHIASLPYPSHKLFLSNHIASLPYPSHKLFLSNHIASLPYPSHKLFLSNHIASLPFPSHKLFLSNHIASLPFPSHKLFLSNHMASLPFPSHKLFLSNHMASIFQDIVSMDTVIMKIMNYAQTLVDADRTSLFLVDNKTSELYARIFDIGGSLEDSKSSKLQKEIRFPKTKGVAGYVATTGETLNITDAYHDERFNREIDIQTGYTTRTLLCMPIFIRGSIIGVVQMVNKKSGVFTASDEKSFQTFAIYCGLALHHAKLYDKIRRSEQKHRVALEVLSYHSKCSELELQTLKDLDIHEPYPRLESYDFDSYSLEIEVMPRLVIDMTKNLFSLSRFDNDELYRFVLTVRKNYRRVPYHNWTHAFAVAHCMYLVIRSGHNNFSGLEALAMYFACLCHDLDHRGRTNSWMKNEGTPLAAVYSTSTMEHHHFNQTITILQHEGHNIFSHLSSTEYKSVLGFMKECILATDLALFFGNKSRLKDLVDKGNFSWEDQEHRRLLRAICMTGCDLSACTKPWNIQYQIVKVIYQEFYAEGDLEKAQGKQPIPMKDRSTVLEVPAHQVGFLVGICLPCYELLAKILPGTKNLVDGGKKNLRLWSERVVKQKEEQRLREEKSEEESKETEAETTDGKTPSPSNEAEKPTKEGSEKNDENPEKDETQDEKPIDRKDSSQSNDEKTNAKNRDETPSDDRESPSGKGHVSPSNEEKRDTEASKPDKKLSR
ncbi:hypothetical protein QZH41_009975, partial [Actinostola sp. cb2023]